MNDVSELDPRLVGGIIQIGQRVFHPLVVETLSEVVSGVCTARLLSVLGSEHCHLRLNHEVLELHGLDEIGVPDIATVADADVSDLLRRVVKNFAALLKVVLATEDGSVLLHSRLHLETDLGCW